MNSPDSRNDQDSSRIQRKGNATGRLGPNDFAQLFGTERSNLPSECTNLIRRADFHFRGLTNAERDDTVLAALKKIESGVLTVAGDENAKSRWEKGWTENLENLESHAFDLASLVPGFIKPNLAVRLHQDYVMPNDPNFELNWYSVFTTWLFQTYFKDIDTVFEFGCGSGINVAALAQMFPDKRIVGLDWTTASKKILVDLRKVYGWRIEGQVFDFFSPDSGLDLGPNSAILTIGALEQTGRRYEDFLNYILKASPSLCVNIEPICEWYDSGNMVDYIAIMHHKRRGYWEGFPERLRELQQSGRVEIIKQKRTFFGSLFVEGYSQNIWRPKKR